ncbi:SH3 domain-containing protein [Baekduia sp. Peel2402]|uniref:SH3 domain-containing protein n=1 Tax=Baekduia sp. Peel2402 TaxID=3458296 RepID=UPI00403E9AD1
MSLSRVSALLAVVALVAPTAAAAKQAPPPKRKLCVDRVTVRDAPHGFAVGYLYRPQKLSVYGRPVDRWVLIRARDGLMGWVPERALCRRAR